MSSTWKQKSGLWPGAVLLIWTRRGGWNELKIRESDWLRVLSGKFLGERSKVVEAREGRSQVRALGDGG